MSPPPKFPIRFTPLVTIKWYTDGATPLYCMNLSGYVGHATVFRRIVHNCVLFSCTVRVSIRVWIRFSVWLVRCYAHVFVRLEVVIVKDRS